MAMGRPKKDYSMLVGNQYAGWTIVCIVEGRRCVCRCPSGHEVESSIYTVTGGRMAECRECLNSQLVGQTFGDWTVVGEAVIVDRARSYPCRCRCGHESLVTRANLIHGLSKACVMCRAKRMTAGRLAT